MPMNSLIISVNDSIPTILTIEGEEGLSLVGLSIQNLSDSKNVYIGDSTVSSSSFGYMLVCQNAIVFENLRKSTEIYAISEDGNVDLAIMRFTFS